MGAGERDSGLAPVSKREEGHRWFGRYSLDEGVLLGVQDVGDFVVG